ncbi:MAG: isoaspartyl peptidase/L-asparaginase [Actinomycetota bacterium]|nr:isoaspartyl peptidase/L-asparaginase [Actinomycetota bacterium]
MTIVYVHGGVSGIAKPETICLDAFVAAGAGATDRLDAVELAVRALEDDPRFNAGYGSVLNSEGILEMDAGLACGATGRVGGVANVRVRHPISLARRVMERTPHVLVTGNGAVTLGRDMEQLPDTSPEERQRWEEARRAGSLTPEAYGSPEHVDTVGAVALDDEGRLAAGSSTGGVFAKLPGRVGDAPIFGAGLYASPEAAVLGTGVGETFLEELAVVRVAVLIERGAAPQEACEEIITLVGRRSTATAGLLALDREGRAGAAYRGGSWAVGGPAGALAATRLP